MTLANYRIAIPKGDVGERQGRRFSIAEALWRKSSNWYIDQLVLCITTWAGYISRVPNPITHRELAYIGANCFD
ncbi:hypothetical protein ACJJID_17340 [Microbulbifer sp. CnH-101-G]|uniref:hypothetical protein n=1 Tax=Microbulbifer sp. CnH-101-G TaxID=3243393 RepID=UPI004039D996